METMTSQRIVKDWRGKSTVAPADLPEIVAMGASGYIVWSRDKAANVWQVRYGLQADTFDNWHAACKSFTSAMSHNGTGMGV